MLNDATKTDTNHVPASDGIGKHLHGCEENFKGDQENKTVIGAIFIRQSDKKGA